MYYRVIEEGSRGFALNMLLDPLLICGLIKQVVELTVIFWSGISSDDFHYREISHMGYHRCKRLKTGCLLLSH